MDMDAEAQKSVRVRSGFMACFWLLGILFIVGSSIGRLPGVFSLAGILCWFVAFVFCPGARLSKERSAEPEPNSAEAPESVKTGAKKIDNTIPNAQLFRHFCLFAVPGSLLFMLLGWRLCMAGPLGLLKLGVAAALFILSLIAVLKIPGNAASGRMFYPHVAPRISGLQALWAW